MGLLDPIELLDADKLEVLRRLDRYRKWGSLADKRYCLVCGQIITGHDVEVVGGTRGTGPLRLICPTRSCQSIPMDWALPTDEVLAKVPMLQKQPIVESGKPQDIRRVKLVRRLRDFAAQFRPAA